MKTVLDRELQATLTHPDVHSYLANHGVHWRFTTELAPWQGGFYERLVGLVKRAFRKGLGRKLLSFDAFVTFLLEVEAMINTRPLTYIGADIDSAQVLTPASFSPGRHRIALPFTADSDATDPEYSPTISTADTVRTNWASQQQLLDAVWSVWEREYLLALRELSTKSISSRSSLPRTPRVGEVVLISDPADPKHRGSWTLGKVTRLIPSPSDQEIRSVALKTATRKRNSSPLEPPLSIRVAEFRRCSS